MEKEKRPISNLMLAKEHFFGFLAVLLFWAVVVVGIVMLCGYLFISGMNSRIQSEINPVVRDTCGILDYEASFDNWDYFDPYYVDVIESQNIRIVCYGESGTWQCSCDEATLP